jgi:alginate O-acetyltransferase complex protein AlgI
MLLVVIVGWVFFRARDLSQAIGYLGSMAGLRRGYPASWHVDLFLDPAVAIAILAGIVGSAPWLRGALRRYAEATPSRRGTLELTSLVLLAAIFFLSALELGAGSYNPFIYFRF